MMVEVKICGVCRPEDARGAAAAGASWVGVILAPGRRRTQTVDAAAGIFAAAGAARRVGVFVDASAGEIVSAWRTLELDAVQLHGDETPALVDELRDAGVPEVWKALRVRDAASVKAGAAEWAGRVDALLLDGWSAAAHGGVGARFDWESVARADALPRDTRIVAAGGLDPGNVVRAVELLRPSIVDVSSGVEESPGRKSMERMRAFVAAVRGVRVGA